MPAPTSADQFLSLAIQSGLLDARTSEPYRVLPPEAGNVAVKPRDMAERLVRDGLLTGFQVEQLLRGKWRNFILNGKYKILSPLGSGGMGHVFLCEHLIMRRRVAIKITPLKSTDPIARDRFRREARAVARLQHRNIVGAHDIDQSDKLQFLVMEFIDGSTLHAIVKKIGPLSPLRASHYIRQAAWGLQHAHEAGLVHRDIKPSNLLLDRSGTVKMLDLGLARFFHETSDDLSKRDGDGPMGTSDYMAPEQALNSHVVDIRADIYSLGATFYFLLAGHGPFQEGTALQKLMSHQFEQPKAIRDIRPEVPEGLAAVLARMLAKDPAERYETPAEVAEALAPWTQTPIPPPSAEEMPLLDLAAQGSDRFVGRSTAAESDAGGAMADTPASGKIGKSPGDSLPPTVPGGGPPVTLIPAGSPPRPKPKPPGPDAKTKAATTPKPQAAPHPDAAASAPPATQTGTRGRRRLLIGIAAVALVVCLAGGFAIYKSIGGKDETGPIGRDPNIPPVPPPKRLALLVPAYYYPDGDGLTQWNRLIESPAASSMVAIMNPDSGPGKAADKNYAQVLERARAAGITVIGYVSTKYAKRPLQEAKDDVDRWVKFYPGIQGVFFDEQASATSEVHYYGALYVYAKKDRQLATVVTNPGTVCAEEYLSRPAADLACVVEVAKDFKSFHRPAWMDSYPPERFAAILCETQGADQMRAIVRQMAEQRMGYCYVTDQ
ncbi:MAG TPA: spherulation-specific family 4 protein, partial [Gemmataceae bacterium]